MTSDDLDQLDLNAVKWLINKIVVDARYDICRILCPEPGANITHHDIDRFLSGLTFFYGDWGQFCLETMGVDYEAAKEALTEMMVQVSRANVHRVDDEVALAEMMVQWARENIEWARSVRQRK